MQEEVTLFILMTPIIYFDDTYNAKRPKPGSLGPLTMHLSR